MMDKILVTTDFSSNSKAACRFAIQLALQHKCELTFFHSYYIANLGLITGEDLVDFENNAAHKIQKKLNKFVEILYKDIDESQFIKKCVIKSGVLVDTNIREYARENNFSFICISTRGSGKLKKIFGSNTSNLIRHSIVPVIAVPFNYRSSEINKIIYASDLLNFQTEMKKVSAFAKPLKAQIEILHFEFPTDVTVSPISLDAMMMTNAALNVKMHFEKINLTESLVLNIQRVIKKSKPSVVIMFTEQSRSFFEKIFHPSKSVNYSFNAKFPLLVFNKT
ncbi:universal stress protein [Flavobacterium frigoris]|uniref:Nucleotide-binding universal stress protein, UspA family n=1 Tax=Flavobacterium frigoris TaxID=229204 RepID=A0A1H9PJC2_FLAFI|nr:universal stress protein [Flavobacterium frigoris]SER48341.1 Nucleotide-binding universal stress protein, UspA family [Flavobacterium frigoris]